MVFCTVIFYICVWLIIIIQAFSYSSRGGRQTEIWQTGGLLGHRGDHVHPVSSCIIIYVHFIHCVRWSNIFISLCSWPRSLFISRPHRCLFWSHLPDTFLSSSACTFLLSLCVLDHHCHSVSAQYFLYRFLSLIPPQQSIVVHMVLWT